MRTKSFSFTKVVFTISLFLISVMAADLKVGTRAPAFSLSNSDGNKTTLQSLIGKKKTVLIFFRTLH